jgi:hypothetical protein
MCSSQASPLKISLRGADKICGCCRHVNHYNIIVSGEDHAVLKKAAEVVLGIRAGVVVPTEVVMRLAAFTKEVGSCSLECKLQKCLTRLGDACGLWQPRAPGSSQ